MKHRLFILAIVWVYGCEPEGHGHSHPHAEHAEQEEAPTLAITRWSDDFELFVELPAPVAKVPIAYHAHVTRLADFGAVTEGTFQVRFKRGTTVAIEAAQEGVKRPGIFVFESPAPEPGTYGLEMSYAHGGKVDTFDCGSVTVGDGAPAPVEEPVGSTITFLKESQWKIPFATAWAGDRPIAQEIELSAVVEPAGVDQLTIGAPTTGRFFHNPKLAVAEGTPVKIGDVLGTFVPAAAGDDFSRLQLAVEESSLAKGQLEREIARVAPLVEQGLLPQRRLVDLQNELETHQAKMRAAGGRLEGVVTPGRNGALVIRSSLAGLVSAVLVGNGQAVEAGAPLLRVGGTDHLWLRARFVAKPASSLLGASPTSVRLPSGEEIDLQKLDARLLSTLPVVDPVSRIATWIVDVAAPKAGSPEAEAATNLRPGTSAVVKLRVGDPRTVLVVPRAAVVEINTRPFVFVQADGEHFEKRSVSVGQTDGPWVHLSSGVRPGERVVTKGGFDIHLAALMGTIESHRH